MGDRGARTALVTGAAAGIGRGIARRLAAGGYRVALLDRAADALAEAVGEVPGGQAVVADVTDAAAVEAAFAGLPFVPDLVVNNAGIVRFGLLADQAPEDFAAVVAVNLVGAQNVTQAAVRRMRPRGSGHVVALTSINAHSPGPGAGAYPASKAGLLVLMRQYALEYGRDGLRFNSVAPGFIDGGMSAPIYADPRVRAGRESGVPLGRLGQIENIAETVAWLDSPGAAYVTGEDIVVDGGVRHAVLANLPRA